MRDSKIGGILAAVILIFLCNADIAFSQNAMQLLPGTKACPKLNAHNKKACKFDLSNHGFQVWPERISIITAESGTRLVQSTGHKDEMFDHVLKLRKDDHVIFQCLLGKYGNYEGPFNFKIDRGGAWPTYGKVVTKTVSMAADLMDPSGMSGALGGMAAKELGDYLSTKYGSKSWEYHARTVAMNICEVLATKLAVPLPPTPPVVSPSPTAPAPTPIPGRVGHPRPVPGKPTPPAPTPVPGASKRLDFQGCTGCTTEVCPAGSTCIYTHGRCFVSCK